MTVQFQRPMVAQVTFDETSHERLVSDIRKLILKDFAGDSKGAYGRHH